MKGMKEVFDKEVDEFKEARDSGNNLGNSLRKVSIPVNVVLKSKIWTNSQKRDYIEVWLIYLKIYIKLIKPLKLGEFPDSEFEVSGRTMTELLEDTLHFSITLYEGLAFPTENGFQRCICEARERP